MPNYPVTPDGKYFVVRGRLWRKTNPNLPADEVKRLTSDLMKARRDKGVALKNDDHSAVDEAKSRVETAKVALGERGPVWWDDGELDFNRKMAKNTPYADWFKGLV